MDAKGATTLQVYRRSPWMLSQQGMPPRRRQVWAKRVMFTLGASRRLCRPQLGTLSPKPPRVGKKLPRWKEQGPAAGMRLPRLAHAVTL